jgi:NADH pyrophosphatase NudC (nudix superfamily)
LVSLWIMTPYAQQERNVRRRIDKLDQANFSLEDKAQRIEDCLARRPICGNCENSPSPKEACWNPNIDKKLGPSW